MPTRSWGTYYADGGFFRVQRDGDNAYDPSEYGCAWANVDLVVALTKPQP